MDQYEVSRKLCERTAFLLQENKQCPSFFRFIQVKVEKMKAKMGEKDIDLAAIIECHTLNKWRFLEGSIQRSIASILFNINDKNIAEAEKWIESAVQADHEYGMIWSLGMDYVTYADLLKRNNHVSRAKEKLGDAVEIFRQCGADGWAQKYEQELAAL